MKRQGTIRISSAFRITLIYVVFALLWILLSDRFISSLTNSVQILTVYSNIKGILFIIITGVLLFLLIQKRINEKNKIITRLDREVEIREQLISELHHRIKNNMQLVLSLINLESIEESGFNLIKDRISNKLLSMMSIFDIVYNLEDMNKISLDLVIKEYVAISIRNLEYLNSKIDAEYSVELITSLMLVIDSLIEIYDPGRPTIGKIGILLADTNRLALRFPEFQNKDRIKKEDMEIIEFQLAAIFGAIETDWELKTVYITFRDEL